MVEIHVVRRAAYDIDDTLVGRERITRLGGALKGRTGYSLPKYTLDALPTFDHTPVDVPGVKRVALWFHQIRVAIPGVAERLRTRASQGTELFAFSGRPATIEWHQTTTTQLDREGIPIPGEKVILTPLGISTAVSKADAIREFEIEEFTDDDLRTLLILSPLFPDRGFNWIRYRPTSIPAPRELLASRPNIHEIPIEEWRLV